jgi:protein phosphatase
MRYESFGITDVGMRRAHNEDAFVIDHQTQLFAAADGIGGAAAGEVASAIYIEACRDVFAHDKGLAVDIKIRKAFYTANLTVLSHAKQHPATKGMGCTAELLSFVDDQYFIGHVGDSRSYRIRQGQIQQLTSDHSYIQDQMDKGLITAEDAKTHWLRNAINRAVGQGPELKTDVLSGKIQDKDCFLLCSDGLSDMLDDDEILNVIRMTGNDLSLQGQALIDAANQQGGNDNITVVLCQFHQD